MKRRILSRVPFFYNNGVSSLVTNLLLYYLQNNDCVSFFDSKTLHAILFPNEMSTIY